MGIVITKLPNGNVEVTGGLSDYTLLPAMHTYRENSNIDGANVISDGRVTDTFRASNVEKLVRSDGTEILTPTGDELYEELREYFFFLDNGTITPGWDLFIPSNDTDPLNTANEIIGTSGGGSFIEFDDLTGVTITSTVGTGALTIVGNDMDFTTSGNIRKITVDDNGITREFLITEGGSIFIKSSDNVLTGSLNGITFSNGVDTANSEGTQTALMSYSGYDIFNAANTSISLSASSLIGKVVTASFIHTGDAARVPLSYSNGSTERFVIESNALAIGFASFDGVLTKRGALHSNSGIKPGDVVNLELTITDYHTVVFKLNGVVYNDSIALGSASSSGATIGDRVGLSKFLGVILNIGIDGVNYNTENDWGGRPMSGDFTKYVAPENPLDLGNDYFGETIQRPYVADALNFSGQEHYFDSNILLGRAGADTDSFFIRPMSNLGNEFFAGDDVVTVGSNVSNQLEIVWNGVTMIGSQIMTKGNWYFIQFGQDGALLGTIWKGTELVSPVVDGIPKAVGAAIATAVTMKYGNKDTSSKSFNGYMTQFLHYNNKLLNDAETVDNWTILKSKATLLIPPAAALFDYAQMNPIHLLF
jgi:hypothetical protein